MGHAAVKHDYHLVDPSPWPFVTSVAMFILAIGAVTYMHGFVGDPLDVVRSFFADEAAARAAMAGGWDAIASAAASNAGWAGMDEATRATLQTQFEGSNAWYWLLGKHQPWILLAGFLFVTYCAASWWGDVIKESKAGHHTPVVGIGLRYGMILFIASEVMFFVAWFWMFFEGALFPEARVVGTIPEVASAWATWPPEGVETLDPWHLPLMNTLILLLSGTTVTWAHHALQEGNRDHAKWGLMATIGLGVIFTCIQAYEYHHILHAEYFSFGGTEYGYYGSTFFMATGFHGAHVLIGTIFLIVCLIRLMRGGFTPQKHFGFEAAAWYWHFVDVVWLFLFAFVYVTFG